MEPSAIALAATTAADAAAKAATVAAQAAVVAAETQKELLKIGFQLENIVRRIGDLEADVKAIQIGMSLMSEMAAKWKGGFLVILALGGIIAWLSSIGSNLMKVVK